jgi:hypothetical protein
MRSNLTSVRVASADGYVPGNQDSNVTSIWTSTGRLVSASPPSSQRFGIIMSDVPYDGSIQVGTITQWFDKSVQFVSMYEIGDYIFTFFRENPDETTDTVRSLQNIIYTIYISNFFPLRMFIPECLVCVRETWASMTQSAPSLSTTTSSPPSSKPE